jgi:hypothetical protein
MSISTRRSIAILIVLMGCSTQLTAQDNIVGAVWEITYRPEPVARKKPQNPVVRRFRATPDGKVFQASAKEIGTWKGNDDDVTMTINDQGGESTRFSGTYRILKIRKDPPTWRGTFTNPRGREIPVGIRLIRD